MTNLFEDKDLSIKEKEFVKNILKDDKTPSVGSLYMQRAQALVTLRLAKEIEKSTISNNKSSKSMNRLTGALVFISLVQIIIAIINILIDNGYLLI